MYNVAYEKYIQTFPTYDTNQSFRLIEKRDICEEEACINHMIFKRKKFTTDRNKLI